MADATVLKTVESDFRAGSTPASGTSLTVYVGVAQWQSTCLLSNALQVRIPPPTPVCQRSSVGRALAFQARRRKFESCR